MLTTIVVVLAVLVLIVPTAFRVWRRRRSPGRLDASGSPGLTPEPGDAGVDIGGGGPTP